MVKDNRYLVKDIDHFAGFAHAIHTYLGGVALASAHNMSLLHLPFQSSHGMGFAFDDFLAGDARGLVAPQAAPIVTTDVAGRLLISGRPTTVATVSRTSTAATIAKQLTAAPADSISWVRKGRFAFTDADPLACANCTITPEARYTALWMRERFWAAVRGGVNGEEGGLTFESLSAALKPLGRDDNMMMPTVTVKSTVIRPTGSDIPEANFPR